VIEIARTPSSEGIRFTGYFETFFFAQRAWAAFWAETLRSAAVIFLASALPPIRANSVIVSGFFDAMARYWHKQPMRASTNNIDMRASA
jgi:hypothetical protein